MRAILNLTVKDFAMIFNIEEKDMPRACIDIINRKDFRYGLFNQDERDKIILDIVKTIDSKNYTVSGKDTKERWEKGWSEIYDNFVSSGFSKDALVPQYNRKGYPVRLFGDYVRTCDTDFETNFVEVIRAFIFHKYMIDKNSIYEFGCGSCYNILAFAEMSPDKYYYGCDWVPQPAKIIDAMRGHYKFNVNGGVFNMFEPNNDLEVREDSVAVTIGALEQLGRDFGKFTDFLLSKPFSRVVHLNSILELYDIDNSLLDYLTHSFETKRNYCNGFFSNLKNLELQGVIKILKMDKVLCGGSTNDGYSITVWEKI